MKKGCTKIIIKGMIVAAILFLSSCIKENIKTPYLFYLYFDSGDTWKMDVFVDDKKEQINLKRASLPETIVVELFKVKNNKITGTGHFSPFYFTKTNGSVDFWSGKIEVDATYERKGKNYIVDNGTFSLLVYDTNQPITYSLHTGKWSLKRKE